MTLPVAIIAGGLATRMRPLTENRPKSLLQVAGDYFINHQLRYLKHQGITKVVLCLGHLGEQIVNVVGNGATYGLDLQYSWDGPHLLGTGGAVRKALPLLGELFFILYGDSYLTIDLNTVEKKYYETNKPALMTIYKNKNSGDKSNVLYLNNRLIEYNKFHTKEGMEHIDYGLGVVRAKALANFSAEEHFDLAAFYHDLSLLGYLEGYEVDERFYEIGSMEGLLATVRKIEKG